MNRWVGCVVVCVAGCVQPGSLDDKEQFQTLLGGDASLAGSGGSGGSAGSAGGAGGGASGSGAQTGCDEACDLIATKCALGGCHGGATPQGGLDLSGTNFVAELISAPATTTACAGELLIDSDAPEQSAFYGKLLDPPSCGLRMPVGTPLSDDEIACILRWLQDDPTCAAGGASSAAGSSGGGMSGAGGSQPEPDAGTDAAASGAVAVWIEAEDAMELSEPLASQTDGAASGGSFISVPAESMLELNGDPSAASGGVARYTFNVGAAGTYRVWGRVRVATTDTDSFWVRMDDGAWTQWNNIPTGTEWHWDDVHDTAATDAVVDFELGAGQHTLRLAYREIGTELDKILITDDVAFVPMGEGQ